MTYIIYSFQQSFLILRKHWQIFLIVLLFSLQPLVNLAVKIPSVITLLISLVSLGWLGTRFEFLKDAYQKDKVPWNQYGSNVIKYIKRLFPIAFLLMTITVIFWIIALIFYGRWYFEDAGLAQDEFVRKQQYIDIFNSLRNPVLIGNFLGQFGLVAVVVSYLLFPILFFIQTITLVILVIEEKGVINSFIRSFGFIKNHFHLFVIVITINIVLSIITGKISSLFGMDWLKNIETNALLTYFITLPNKFIHLLIDGAAIIYYLESKKRLRR